MKTLFVAWQDPKTRFWHPVGRLTFGDGLYRFAYTQGAQKSPRFRPFGRLSDLQRSYVSRNLFPLFLNRVLHENRPEYSDFLTWVGLDTSESDAFEILDRTGGERQTDSIVVFACPVRDSEGFYTAHFFSHGIRHLPKASQERVNELAEGDTLFPMLDVHNPYDTNAVMLRTGDPATLVGYCPRYRALDFGRLIQMNKPDDVLVTVERVNPDAPTQLRLLCKLRAAWPSNFRPCQDSEYELIDNGQSASAPKTRGTSSHDSLAH